MMKTLTTAVTKDVVLNDNVTAIDPAKQMTTALDRLIKDRQTWEVGAYNTSNKELYAILTKCYAIDFSMSGSETYAKIRKQTFNDYVKQQGLMFKGETPLINRIVKCVFGDVQRSRISAYAKVLKEAKRQAVAIKDLSDFISNSGGIQEIRLSKTENYVSPKDKATIATEMLANIKLATVKGQQLSETINVEKADETCVLLATQKADGSFVVQSVVYSATAVNAALVSVYGTNAHTRKANIAKQEAVNDSEEKAAAILSIVNM